MPEDFEWLWDAEPDVFKHDTGWQQSGDFYGILEDRDLFCAYYALSI